jgi:hypothetical protein
VGRVLQDLARGIGGALPPGCMLYADANGELSGRVIDPVARAVPGAEIRLLNLANLVERSVPTYNESMYEMPALPVGTYRFRVHIVEPLTIEVARTLTHDVHLELGDIAEEVTVASGAQLIDAATTSVGHVVDGSTVQELPLNGRYFLDLAILSPGSAAPSQNGFNTTPFRALGALAINLDRERIALFVSRISEQDASLGSILVTLTDKLANTPIHALDKCKRKNGKAKTR